MAALERFIRLIPIIKLLTPTDLKTLPNLVYELAVIAQNGHPAPLEALTSAFTPLPQTTLRSLDRLSKNTLHAVAGAAVSGAPSTLNQFARGMLQHLSLNQLMTMHASTIKSLSIAACENQAEALNCVAPLLEKMKPHHLASLDLGTFQAVAKASELGHHAGLMHLGSAVCKSCPSAQRHLDPSGSFLTAYYDLCERTTPRMPTPSSMDSLSSLVEPLSP